MTSWGAEVSPRFKARLAGVFEVLEALTSRGGQVLVLGRLVVSGDAAATAASILEHEQLFWLGFALSLIGVVCHIVWGASVLRVVQACEQERLSICLVRHSRGMRDSGGCGRPLRRSDARPN